MLRCSIIILAIAGLCLSPDAVAQEGSRSVGQSLSERFGALRNVFKRNDAPASPRSDGNAARSPRPPMPYDPADLQRQQQASRPIQPQVVPQKSVAKARTPVVSRRSPAVSSREAELDEALADLLAPTPRSGASTPRSPAASNDEVPNYLEGLVDERQFDADEPLSDADETQTAPAAVGSRVAESSRTSGESAPTAKLRRNPFDLHRALSREKAESTRAEDLTPTPNQDLTPTLEESHAAEQQPPVEDLAESAAPESKAFESAAIDSTPVDLAGTNNLRPKPTAQSPVSEPVVETTTASAEVEANSAWRETAAGDVPAPTADPVMAPFDEDSYADAVESLNASQAAPSRAAPELAATQAQDASTFISSYVQPLIQSHVEGPRHVVVGRSSTFIVRLRNSGETAAETLTATIAIPAWADVVDASPSTGVVQHASTDDGAHSLQWRLSELKVSEEQTLTLELIPRSGQPLQLAVQWTHAPVGTTATVEVREPKLNIAITGPGDVLFGKPQRYKLLLTNPGNGLAEGVSIRLTPPGGTAADVIEHPVGDLPAGAKHDIELELVAREAGELTVEASAVAMGGLEAATIKHVTCRKPELQLDWRGPDKKYAGTVATYYFRVRNPGAAATEDLVIDVQLPPGAELLAASEGHEQLKNGLVRWRGMPLTPGEQRFMQMRCKLNHPGANQVTATAKCDSIDLADTKTFATHVIALADLKLEVADPKGPVAVGEEALYTVRVVNRGTTAASNVNVVAMFSAGIDPTTVEGAEHAVEDGRVAFRPITSLPAGQHVELRIRARAGQPGTHVFRTEVVCTDLDTKLAAEETTRFFVDEQRWDDPSRAYSTASAPSETTTR